MIVEYLPEKYTKNIATVTIGQAGSVMLSFLIFLNARNTNIFHVTCQDISGFVAHEQDRGVKIDSVRGKMRALYAFINFLLGKELLPYDILHKKIRIKEPELRCGLRVEEVANLTFYAIDYWRNQIIVRGGVREQMTGFSISATSDYLPTEKTSDKRAEDHSGGMDKRGRIYNKLETCR